MICFRQNLIIHPYCISKIRYLAIIVFGMQLLIIEFKLNTYITIYSDFLKNEKISCTCDLST